MVALKKIAQFTRVHPTSILSESDQQIAPEELPALLYQMTTLIQRCSGSSSSSGGLSQLKNVIVELLAQALDSLIITRAVAKDLANADSIHASVRETATFYGCRINNVVATVIHHLSLLISKDHAIAQTILEDVKMRRITCSKIFIDWIASIGATHIAVDADIDVRSPVIDIANVESSCGDEDQDMDDRRTFNSTFGALLSPQNLPRISTGKLLMCLLMGKSARFEAKSILAFTELLLETNIIEEKASSR